MENLKPKKYISLKTKITASIVVFVVLTLGVIFTISYINTASTIKTDLYLRLLNEVNIAVLQIDADKHSLLQEPADEETDAYKDIKLVLQKIRNNSTDIYYIYTMRENQNKDLTFIVDAEEDPAEISHLGDVYADASPFLKENFSNIKGALVEKDFSTDQWGTWVSAYAPIYDKYGRREGLLGIDIKSSDIVNNQRKVLSLFILIFILSGLLATILGIFLSKNLVKSVTSLTDILKSGSNIDEKINLHAASGEIGELADALRDSMKKSDVTQKESESRIADKTKVLEKMNELMVGRELEMIKLKKEINELKKEKGL
jgi:methyl-accepting chemotaxis protein